jgi:flagellar basal-body rod modification protein FlgD
MAVMNVKRSTTASPATTHSAPPKGEDVNQVGAAEFKKAYGDQNVGEVLNKVADPNWVDPAKKMRAVGKNQLDKDSFLKLMLAQMKHQDPTNPMQSHEMAAQLAQFTSLEQLNNINTTLEQMKNAQNPNSNYQALALIGKRVSGDASKLTRAAGDTKHAFGFETSNDAVKVKVSIKDVDGKVIRKMELGAMKKGHNTIEWNGMNEEGMPARPGEYKFAIEAVGSSGEKVYTKTAFEGKITGLNYTAEGPVLLVGQKTIKLSEVKKIEDAGPEDSTPATALGVASAKSQQATTALQMTKPSSQGTMVAANQAPTQMAKPAAKEEFIPAAEEPEPPAKNGNNVEDIPMSRELLNKITTAKQ